MKLFLPSARATNVLLVVGFAALGYALYLRYMAHRTIDGRALPAAPASTPGFASRAALATTLFQNSVFGIVALVDRGDQSAAAVAGVVRAWRSPSPALGVVLYNIVLSSLAIGLLILSLARREPEQA